MDFVGLSLAARYAYPPNSLSLCGPHNQNNLIHYTTTGTADKGTAEIISKFSTLYPYLCLIAGENHLKDPFNSRVVEAYWLGNNLLRNVPAHSLIYHLTNTLDLHRKQPRIENEKLSKKIVHGGLPNHAFHVLNVYTRTGLMTTPHTVETLDACIINYGKVVKILKNKVVVLTSPLQQKNNKLDFGIAMQRLIKTQGDKDKVLLHLDVGEWVSYHWGYICEKITPAQKNSLKYFTRLAISLANLQI